MEYYIKLDNNKIIAFSPNFSDQKILVDFTNEQIEFLNKNFPFVSYINNQLVLNNELKNKTLLIAEKEKRVNDLKKMLSNSDYKITKCYEASMRQLPLPYNLEEVCTERDAWREEINNLEQELAELE